MDMQPDSRSGVSLTRSCGRDASLFAVESDPYGHILALICDVFCEMLGLVETDCANFGELVGSVWTRMRHLLTGTARSGRPSPASTSMPARPASETSGTTRASAASASSTGRPRWASAGPIFE